MSDLALQHCVPCEGGAPPLTVEDAKGILEYMKEWVLAPDGKRISRDFTFGDFKESLAFVNKVGEIAESEGHHPNVFIWWNKVRLELFTHAINGLSTNDFILAAKVNTILPA